MICGKAFLLVSFCLCATLPAQAADTLMVATGKVEITGPAGYPMGGYGARKGVNQGTHDPLLAKILLIKTGDRQIGIVTYDILAFLSERVAREAKEKLGIPLVLQIASHTHSGPVPKSMANFKDDPYIRDVEGRVLEALKTAQGRFVPARIGVTETSIQIGHNRRKVNPDGSVTMFWRNEERVPTSPVDPRVGIIRFSDAANKTLALMVNHACHSVVLGPDNLQYSADWPGYMYRYVESQLGDPALCYFIPGASGDINPYDDKQPVNKDGFGVAQKTGETVAKAVLEAVKTMPPGSPDLDLQYVQELSQFKDRFDAQKTIPVQVTRLMLGQDTAILCIPGEVFVSHQIDLRTRSPLPHTFLAGYAFGGEGGFAGYVPTIEAAMQGGYGAGYATRIEVGAGEWIIDRAIVWVYERLGKLRDVPDVPKN
jgi:neutral ceramidase